MFMHLLKPIWKRKSRNLMLSLEIFLAFLMVFAVVAIAGRFFQLAQLPTGFHYESVWSVAMYSPDDKPTDAALYDKFKRSLEALPEVEKVAFVSFPPYQRSAWNTDFSSPDSGGSAGSNMMEVSDDFFAATDMKIEQGRWFSSVDEGAAERPVVINRQFAEALFPGENPVGKTISQDDPFEKNPHLMRITGVFDTFRSWGEFAAPTNFVFARMSTLSQGRGARNILLKLKPGTGRIFEAKLNQQLKLVRNDWGYQISPLSVMRKDMMRASTMPLVVLAVVAAFLLIMVGFGLFGVLWQNTTRRIPEIGLRRAAGATAGNIYRQIITEQLLITSLAVSLGLILLVQLPITGVFGDSLNWPLFGVAALLTALIMALVSVLCALYPAWRASRLSPTEALHYE